MISCVRRMLAYNAPMDNLHTHTLPFGIESYDLHEIEQLVAELGLPRFRNKQLVQWLYGHAVVSYNDMSNLPAKMREALAQKAPLNIPEVKDKQVSRDGSRKYVLALADGAQVETVGIPSTETNTEGAPKRLTVCFSTQVGCAMECAFCATGKEGFSRNLYPGEMVQQILTVQRDFGMRVSNVVAMGQGEPFLNYHNLVEALHIINHKDCLNIGARHITVSTCGILDAIARFGEEPEQYTLAISLHSARQGIRDSLMPRCKGMPLQQLKSSLRDYYLNSKRRPSLEYLMIKDVNDAEIDLDALLAFCEGLNVHINLIPLNNIDGSPWIPSTKETMQRWIQVLNEQGIESTIRNSRGSDIAGACGQLKNSLSK